MGLKLKSAAQQSEMRFNPDSRPGPALMRGSVVHSNHNEEEFEAHLRRANMPAKQQERDNDNSNEQRGEHGCRQDPWTLEEARCPWGWLLQPVGQAGDPHVIDRVNLGFHGGGARVTFGGITPQRAQNYFLSLGGKLGVK